MTNKSCWRGFWVTLGLGMMLNLPVRYRLLGESSYVAHYLEDMVLLSWTLMLLFAFTGLLVAPPSEE